MGFHNLYDQGLCRVAAATTVVHIADPAANAAEVITQARALAAQGVGVMVFPELCLVGYAIDDLLLQDVVLDGALAAIAQVAAETADLKAMVIVGAPLRRGHRLYNCAVVLRAGRVLGVVPKSYLPNYREFYEKRHFALGHDLGGTISLLGDEVAFGSDLLFEATDVSGLVVHVEVCEDLWVPVPPSARAALAGATVLVNLSGSPITVGKSAERHMLCESASARCTAAYLYAAAGQGESSTDLSWDGQTMIYELGRLLAETDRFAETPGAAVADIDLDVIRQERLRVGSFDDNAVAMAPVLGAFRTVTWELAPNRDADLGLQRVVDRFPFVPDDPAALAQDCYEAYRIQVYGLEQRMKAIGTPKAVIGVSGGLDSTHALLVACQAMDRLGRPRTDVLAYTMPGFATTDHTKNNALALCAALGVPCEILDIRPAATQMLRDMGHPAGEGAEVYDITFENVQAGLRYDYLFRLANQRGGIVVGTGDLSELALGWCTYGVGDQMSHYAVNTGVPKTLIQHLIRWVVASGQFDSSVNEVLESILGTEISPELVPTRPGEKPQSTQATIGPYELHDFTLYYLLRRGLRPSKIAFLAEHAWRDVDAGPWPPNHPADGRHAYDRATIVEWMQVFGKRFMGNQFKRSALPNGPKVMAGGALSPRGDWRSPSDGNARAWLAELDTVPR